MESHVQTSGLNATVLPVCVFPPVHWWCYAVRKHVVLDSEEMYVKQTVRNRMNILGVNGPIMLSIPVESTKGLKTPIKAIRIQHGDWKKSYLRSIRSAYGRAAFFEYYYGDIESILMTKHDYLLDLNLESIAFLKSKMKVESPWIYADKSPEHGALKDDLRSHFEPASFIPEHKVYPQVFSDRMGFSRGLSAIDLLFNMGPRAIDYLLLKKNSED